MGERQAVNRRSVQSTNMGRREIPASIYLLGMTIFAITTSEFMVAGMMPSLAAAFDVSVARIGYLISLYAIGMVVGGPLLTALVLTLRVTNKTALIWQLVLYAASGAVAAMSTTYEVMAISRVLTGIAGSACIGVALALCNELVGPTLRGRASSIVIGGMMLATVLGVPGATFIDQQYGWRASFWLVIVAIIACVVVVARVVPSTRQAAAVRLGQQLRSFRNAQLWAAYLTSGVMMGASYAAFSYITPIATTISGVASTSIPVLLSLYGVASLAGTMVIGTLVDRHIYSVTISGLVVLATALGVFATQAETTVLAISAFLVIGFSGASLSPALIARVMRVAEPGALVNSVHVSIINSGLAFIAWAGGVGIDAGHGYKSPLWIGFLLALLALATLTPRKVRGAMTQC